MVKPHAAAHRLLDKGCGLAIGSDGSIVKGILANNIRQHIRKDAYSMLKALHLRIVLFYVGP